MRRTASEVLRNLERRVARLERKASKFSLDTLVKDLSQKTGKKPTMIKSKIFSHLEMLFENYAEMFDEEYDELVSKNSGIKGLVSKGIMGKTLDDQEGKSLKERDMENFIAGIMADDSQKEIAKYFLDYVR